MAAVILKVFCRGILLKLDKNLITSARLYMSYLRNEFHFPEVYQSVNNIGSRAK